jgi:hypothetical protein
MGLIIEIVISGVIVGGLGEIRGVKGTGRSIDGGSH